VLHLLALLNCCASIQPVAERVLVAAWSARSRRSAMHPTTSIPICAYRCAWNNSWNKPRVSSNTLGSMISWEGGFDNFHRPSLAWSWARKLSDEPEGLEFLSRGGRPKGALSAKDERAAQNQICGKFPDQLQLPFALWTRCGFVAQLAASSADQRRRVRRPADPAEPRTDQRPEWSYGAGQQRSALSTAGAGSPWRRLKGTNQLPKVIAGVRFENGIEVIEVPANHAA
jgi:hypothetical protein